MTCWFDACWNDCVTYGVYTTECRNISNIVNIIIFFFILLLIIWWIRDGQKRKNLRDGRHTRQN